jgi:hypothetical protein
VVVRAAVVGFGGESAPHDDDRRPLNEGGVVDVQPLVVVKAATGDPGQPALDHPPATVDLNDAYLCVVPGRGRSEIVRLPFDDDPMLSIILSKAMLLAADDKITDRTILHQLSVT